MNDIKSLDSILAKLDLRYLYDEKFKYAYKKWKKNYKNRYDDIFGGEKKWRIYLPVDFNYEEYSGNDLLNRDQMIHFDHIYYFFKENGFDIDISYNGCIKDYINGFFKSKSGELINIKETLNSWKKYNNKKCLDYFKQLDNGYDFHKIISFYLNDLQEKLKKLNNNSDVMDKYKEIRKKYNIPSNKKFTSDYLDLNADDRSKMTKELNNLIGLDVVNNLNKLASLFYQGYKRHIEAEEILYNEYLNKFNQAISIIRERYSSKKEFLFNIISDAIYNDIIDYDKVNLEKALILLSKESKNSNVSLAKILFNNEIDKFEQYYNSRPSLKFLTSKFQVVISRHPYDIAGKSTNRRWTSCMRLPDPKDSSDYGGAYHEYVFKDILEGTLEAYLIFDYDKNINNPLSRISIKPFINTNGQIYLDHQNKFYLDENAIPNVMILAFKNSINKWINEIQKDITGYFTFRDDLYSDSHDISETYRFKLPEDQLEILDEFYNEILYFDTGVQREIYFRKIVPSLIQFNDIYAIYKWNIKKLKNIRIDYDNNVEMVGSDFDTEILSGIYNNINFSSIKLIRNSKFNNTSFSNVRLILNSEMNNCKFDDVISIENCKVSYNSEDLYSYHIDKIYNTQFINRNSKMQKCMLNGNFYSGELTNFFFKGIWHKGVWNNNIFYKNASIYISFYDKFYKFKDFSKIIPNIVQKIAEESKNYEEFLDIMESVAYKEYGL